MKVTSGGYQWAPSTAGVVNPTYADGAVNETFGKSDLLYGPNTAKPGPGNGFALPFYSGQDISNSATSQSFMFIDLNVGNTTDRASIDSGSARVDFEVSGVYETVLSFNAYAWAYSANVADSSINWTNRLSTNPAEAGQSGYSITTTAAATVPEPASLAVLGVGLVGVGFLARTRRRRPLDRAA